MLAAWQLGVGRETLRLLVPLGLGSLAYVPFGIAARGDGLLGLMLSALVFGLFWVVLIAAVPSLRRPVLESVAGGPGRTGRTAGREDIVLCSTAEWDNPFWTNKQHVASVLAQRGHRVFYIESLGLRRPSASAPRRSPGFYDALRRRPRGPRAGRRQPLGLVSPSSCRSRGTDGYEPSTGSFLHIGLSMQMAVRGLRKDLLWTYNPMTTRLLGVERWRASGLPLRGRHRRAAGDACGSHPGC